MVDGELTIDWMTNYMFIVSAKRVALPYDAHVIVRNYHARTLAAVKIVL